MNVMSIYFKGSLAVEMIAILAVLTLQFHRKPYFWLKTVVGVIALLCFSALWETGNGTLLLVLRYFLVIFLIFVLLEICYEEKINAKLFALTAAYSVQSILYMIYTIALYLIENISENAIKDVVQVIVYIIVFGTGIWLSYRYLAKRMNVHKNINVDNGVMIVLAITIILVSNIFNLLMIRTGIPNYAYELIYKPMSIIPCAMLLCLQFNIINSQSLLSERNTLEQLLKEKDEQYQVSKANIELIQLKCHDLKYQIEAFQRNNEHVDQEALSEIQKNINIYDGIVKTGNEALDVILTEKSLFCEKHKIKITVMLDGSSLNHMNVSDLYCVFGNAIDNAIEAVEKQEDVDKRLISITSNHVGNLFSIRIANYYSGELILKDGMPISSKPDKRYHGFGMKSILYIVEKYDGSMSIHKENDLFVLNLLLPLK